MAVLSGLTVRGSGRYPGKFYVDLSGRYATGDIAAVTGLAKDAVEEVYQRNGASPDESTGVWFFDSREQALQAIHALGDQLAGMSGKAVFLTYEEIDYIRQALINEGSNIINVRNELKRRIFEKING